MLDTKKSYLSAAALGGLSRGLSIVIRFLSVPMTVGLLSQERYGLWLVVSSLVGWLGFSDLGIPAALQNRLITVLNSDSRENAKAVVSFAMKVLIFSGVLIMVLGCLSGFLVPWTSLLKVDPIYHLELSCTICLCVAALAIGLPSRVGGVISNAHGRLEFQPLADIAAQLASFAMLLLAVWLQWRSVFALALCSMVAITVGPVLLTKRAMAKFGYSYRSIPATKADKDAIVGKGIFFFLTIIGELMILQSDALIIGTIKGAAFVPLFVLPMALMINLLQLQNIFLRPLWPLLAMAYAASDMSKFLRLFFTSLKCSAAAGSVFLLCCVTLGDWFVRLWTKDMVGVSPVMAWGLGLYGLISTVDNAVNACLNATGLIEIRFMYILSVGIVKVGLAIIVLKFYDLKFLPIAYAALGFVMSIPFAVFSVQRMTSRKIQA